VLGREVEEGQQGLAVLLQLLGGLGVLGPVALEKALEGVGGLLARRGAIQIACRAALALLCRDLGKSVSTLPSLWNQQR
jgi:hypothetical protein